MPKFAANLTLLFTEVPFLERFAAAAEAGFRGVEFLFPYDTPAQEIKQRLDENGLEVVLFNLPPGNWEGGERGLAALPGRQAEFAAGLDQALDYADALNCRRLHVLAGVVSQGTAVADMRKAYRENLGRAVERVEGSEVTLLIEPINTCDIPGYFLNFTCQAKEEIDFLGSNRLRLQLDLYHRQIMEGDLTQCLETYLDITGHIQIANPPDRTEPSAGEINYPPLFEVIDRSGYSGWVGCEYRPSTRRTRDSLQWMEPYTG